MAAQGRHVDLIDQVAQKCRLRQNLGVEERRLGLEGYGQELLESMEAAWRMHIVERNGEDQSPEESREEARKAASARIRTPANDMVTLVYCLEKWVQMIRGFNLRGGRDEHQWQAGPTNAAPQRFGEA